MRITVVFPWVILVCALGLAELAHGDVFFQSASLNADPSGGTSLISDQWLGVRFEVDQPLDVTSVGGELIYCTGTLFGAIVSLGGPTGLPPGQEFDGANVVAETTFTAPDTGNGVVNDYQTPLPVTLDPGEYGLVFGSEAFGATGTGAMTFNTNIGNPSYFDWYPPQGGWVQGAFYPTRFVIDGTVVPEPVPSSMLAAAFLAVLAFRPRKAALRCQRLPTPSSHRTHAAFVLA
jgi:hypothetical protein